MQREYRRPIIMQFTRWLAFVLLLAAPFVGRTEDTPVTFYVQLIRGTSDEKPPDVKAKAVESRLDQYLKPVFRWKKYWAVSQREVKVAHGKSVRVSMSVHDVEIRVLSREHCELRLFQKEHLIQTLRQKLNSDTPAIMGGARDGENVWFVVVRRDRPLRSADK